MNLGFDYKVTPESSGQQHMRVLGSYKALVLGFLKCTRVSCTAVSQSMICAPLERPYPQPQMLCSSSSSCREGSCQCILSIQTISHVPKSQRSPSCKQNFLTNFLFFFFLPGCTNLLEHDIEKPPGVDVYSRLNYFPKHKK